MGNKKKLKQEYKDIVKKLLKMVFLILEVIDFRLMGRVINRCRAVGEDGGLVEQVLYNPILVSDIVEIQFLVTIDFCTSAVLSSPTWATPSFVL